MTRGAFLIFALLTMVPAGAQPLGPVTLEIRSAFPPAAVAALGRIHLVYELHVTSHDTEPVELLALEALDDVDRQLERWQGRELAEVLSRVGGGGEPGTTLDPGETVVAWLWLDLPPGREPPDVLRHRLLARPPEGEATWVRADRVSLAAPPARLGPPVGAGRWVTVRAPSSASGHRRSLVVLDGAARIPQRFAVDWVALGDDGRFFSGGGRSNDDWYGFGRAVLAVAPGVVVRATGDQSDHPPFAPPPPRRDTATGNTVVVDHGDGSYGVYAHLRQGSLRVEEGDRIEAGTKLGEVGNSGHGLAPHLHVHLADAPEPLAAEGLPFTLAELRLIGRIDDLASALRGAPWAPRPDRPARTVHDEIPLENMVVELE